jgi:hypothetical protein
MSKRKNLVNKITTSSTVQMTAWGMGFGCLLFLATVLLEDFPFMEDHSPYGGRAMLLAFPAVMLLVGVVVDIVVACSKNGDDETNNPGIDSTGLIVIPTVYVICVIYGYTAL